MGSDSGSGVRSQSFMQVFICFYTHRKQQPHGGICRPDHMTYGRSLAERPDPSGCLMGFCYLFYSGFCVVSSYPVSPA